MNLTENDVREILRLLDETEYDELKLQTDSFSLTLRQTAGEDRDRESGALQSTAEAAADEAVAPVAAAAPKQKPASGAVREIYPPLPGTFYRAPSPGAEPFVEVGATVQDDTVVGLVETMKLMNSVMAACRGEVIEICVDNGALIEADTVLLRIRESQDRL